MPVPQNKAELLAAIDATFSSLSSELARVPPERARDRSMPGHAAGTMMSPADLVAYLIGWNELVLAWFATRSRGAEPVFPAAGYGWNQLGDLAQQFYREHDAESWPDLLVRLDSAKAGITALVEDLDGAKLYGTPWYRTYTAGRMIQLNTSSPYANARGRVRAWLREEHVTA